MRYQSVPGEEPELEVIRVFDHEGKSFQELMEEILKELSGR